MRIQCQKGAFGEVIGQPAASRASDAVVATENHNGASRLNSFARRRSNLR
jgi:hypothetical protein